MFLHSIFSGTSRRVILRICIWNEMNATRALVTQLIRIISQKVVFFFLFLTFSGTTGRRSFCQRSIANTRHSFHLAGKNNRRWVWVDGWHEKKIIYNNNGVGFIVIFFFRWIVRTSSISSVGVGRAVSIKLDANVAHRDTLPSLIEHRCNNKKVEEKKRLPRQKKEEPQKFPGPPSVKTARSGSSGRQARGRFPATTQKTLCCFFIDTFRCYNRVSDSSLFFPPARSVLSNVPLTSVNVYRTLFFW